MSKRLSTSMQISAQKADIISNLKFCFESEIRNTVEIMGQRPTLQKIMQTISMFPRVINILSRMYKPNA
jgi:hypothetical protein